MKHRQRSGAELRMTRRPQIRGCEEVERLCDCALEHFIASSLLFERFCLPLLVDSDGIKRLGTNESV